VTLDPFLRFALVGSCVAFAAGLYAIFGWWRALILVFVGGLAAGGLSVETGEPPSRDELKEQLRTERPRTDADGRPRGFRRVGRG
jgi:hypothetical protein